MANPVLTGDINSYAQIMTDKYVMAAHSNKKNQMIALTLK
jgi:hypothetical protein